MDIRYVAQGHTRQNRFLRPMLRRLLADVLPTLVLLLIMALGMSMVARYAESSHLKPIYGSDQSLLQFSD